MLSVSTTAVHPTLRPKSLEASPSPPGHGCKARRSWNCEFRAKRSCRSNAARKLLTSDKNESNIGIDIRCQTVCFQQSPTDSNKNRVSHEIFVDFKDEKEQKASVEPLQSDSTESQSNSEKNVEKTKNLRSIPFLKSAQVHRSNVSRLRNAITNTKNKKEGSSKSAEEENESFGIFQDITATGNNDQEDITTKTKKRKLEVEELKNIENAEEKNSLNENSFKSSINTSISGLSNEFNGTEISEKSQTRLEVTENDLKLHYLKEIDNSSNNDETDDTSHYFNINKATVNNETDDKTTKHNFIAENLNKIKNNEENNENSIVKEISYKKGDASKIDTLEIRKCSSKMSLALNFLESAEPTKQNKNFAISQEIEPISTNYINFDGANSWETEVEPGILSENCEEESKDHHFMNSTSKNYAFKEFNEKPIVYNAAFNDNNGSSNKKVENYQIQELNFENSHYLTGFPNPPGENRCWLNATLHALFGLPLLDHLCELEAEYNMKECSELTQTLLALRLFWTKGEKQKIHQALKMFKESLGILDESYPSQCQQDVSEFLMIFLNYIKNDFEKMLSKKNEEIYNQDNNVSETENIPENRQNYRGSTRSPQTPSKRRPLQDISPLKRKTNGNSDNLSNETSPKIRKIDFTYSARDLSSPRGNGNSGTNDPSYRVHTPPQLTKNDVKTIRETTILTKNPVDRYFLLKMMEHYVCLSCGKNRQRKIDNLMIYVDLPSESSTKCAIALDEAIAKSLGSEERVLTCGKCKHDKHKVSTSFRTIPKVLMVQVNRYGLSEDGSVGKFNTAVEIPATLRLDLNFSNSENGNEIIEDFEPVCIISHVGSAMDCGHYTSYVKHGNSWYHYNDLSVNEISCHEALFAAETTAYLVFFVNSRIDSRDSEKGK